MAKVLVGLLVGTLFGAGLTVSQMVQPSKVLAFLDVLGAWDPSLALVMVGAVLAAAPGFALARRRSRAILGGPIDLPTSRTVDGRLLGGAAIFGIGWGAAGLCPGPALSALASGSWEVLVFVVAMLGGALAHRAWVAK